MGVALRRRQRHQSRQAARHGHDAKHGWWLLAAGRAALVAQQQGDAECLVQNAWKWVRRIDRHRCQQGIDLALVEVLRMLQRGARELLPLQHAHVVLLERGQQVIVPAGILRLHKVCQVAAQHLEPSLRRQATLVRALRLVETLFNLLQNPGNANLDKLIEVACGDGEELHPLEQRIAGVDCLREHTRVELEPALIAAKEHAIERRRRRNRHLLRDLGLATLLAANAAGLLRLLAGGLRGSLDRASRHLLCRVLPRRLLRNSNRLWKVREKLVNVSVEGLL